MCKFIRVIIYVLIIKLCGYLSLADPAAGRGANLARGPNLGYPKNENSTDLTHYFLGWTQIHFRKKLKGFWELLGDKKYDAPFLGFVGGGGHGRVGPLDPPVVF